MYIHSFLLIASSNMKDPYIATLIHIGHLHILPTLLAQN